MRRSGGNVLRRFASEYAAEMESRGATVTVSQAPDKPQMPTEVIAQDIAAIAEAMKKIDGGKLTRKALVILLAHETKLAQKNIKAVLDALHALGKLYLKP